MCQCNQTGVLYSYEAGVYSFIPCDCGVKKQPLDTFIAEVRAKIEEARNGANQGDYQSNIR